jgi:UbiD family decarboxylase
MASVQLLEALQEHNLPIKDAVAPLETLATWCVLQVDNGKLAEMKTNPDELCTKIGNIAFKSKATMLINRILLIGDDVDIHNWTDVIWAYTSRCRPGIDEYVFDEVMGLPLTPYRKYGRGSSVKGGKMVSNCLLAMEYDGNRIFRGVDFRSSYPPELQEKIEGRWTQMGFDAV